MIRVNLLQVKRKKKAKPLPSFVVIGVLVAVAVIAACGFVYFSQNRTISSLKMTVARNEAKIKELKEKVKEVDDFEAMIKRFRERKKVIEDLRKNQSVPVKILNEINLRLADGVWLESMKIEGDRVKISGVAFTNSNVVDFVNNLKRSGLFADVYLEESKKSKSQKKMEVFSFKLRFRTRV